MRGKFALRCGRPPTKVNLSRVAIHMKSTHLVVRWKRQQSGRLVLSGVLATLRCNEGRRIDCEFAQRSVPLGERLRSGGVSQRVISDVRILIKLRTMTD